MRASQSRVYVVQGTPLRIPLIDDQHTASVMFFFALRWSKQIIALRLLELGYHVHGSDVDVFYFRDVLLGSVEEDGVGNYCNAADPLSMTLILTGPFPSASHSQLPARL